MHSTQIRHQLQTSITLPKHGYMRIYDRPHAQHNFGFWMSLTLDGFFLAICFVLPSRSAQTGIRPEIFHFGVRHSAKRKKREENGGKKSGGRGEIGCV